MKYKVTTNLLENLDYGEEIEPAPAINDTCDKRIAQYVIDRNPDWFQPVPEVEAGQYWEWECDNRVFRIESVHNDGYSIRYINEDTSTTLLGTLNKARKLSDSQVEQAIKEEAKRSGFDEEGVKVNPASLGYYYPPHVLSGDEGFRYSPSRDEFYYNEWIIYKQGEFAEIITDEWEVEPYGRFYKLVKNEDYILASVGKCGLDKEQATEIKDALNDLNP